MNNVTGDKKDELTIEIFKRYFFRYVILDNFLSKNHFEFLSNKFNIDNLPGNEHVELFCLRINNSNNIKKLGSSNIRFSNAIPDYLLIEMNNIYKPILDMILLKLCPLKVNLIDGYDYQLVVTGKDFKYPIHDDLPHKLLSTVIYLAPIKNKGTILYSSRI